jgi:biopolymer transport protein TolQ
MTPATLIAMQAAVEALPEDAPVQSAELAQDAVANAAAASAGSDLNLVQLVLDASLPVQFIMALLIVA